jgi:RNA polymerase sigma-70 factor (ECF subfamily)
MADAPDLLESLYDAHAGALFAYALNLTRSEADARDLLQDQFHRLARQPMPAAVRDARGWLLRSIHHLAIDRIRRRATRDRVADQWSKEPLELFATHADPDETAFRQGLAEALGELPEDQRSVVHLKLWEGLTFEAIARLLDIPPNTAASRYRYGIDKLRARLRPLYEEIR